MSDIIRVKKFATGMLGISITAMILSNLDKIILSKMLTLEDFGYYSISCTLGFLIYQIIGPFTQSYFPKFSSLISSENNKNLKIVYHQACQLVSVLVIPVTFILVFFSKELIFIWSGDVILSEKTWLMTSVFAFGTGVNGLMNIPHMLTLAYGWTKLGFHVNIIFVVITIPLLYFLVLNFGSLGGALSWSIINILYFSFVPHIIHRRILKNELSKWYLKDNILPLFLVFAIVGSSKYLIFLLNLVEQVGLSLILMIGFISVLAVVLLMKDLRDSLYRIVKNSLNHE
jgi:O-antigen/teichoic acid export membrane protein